MMHYVIWNTPKIIKIIVTSIYFLLFTICTDMGWALKAQLTLGNKLCILNIKFIIKL